MKETKKNAVLRVFQTARCSSARYIIGVACSSVSILLSGVPFYTIYQIVRIFLEASLNNTAVDVSAAWLWAGITLASIAVGIVLSIIGSFVCHSCAFHALYDLRMRILNHMGRLNLGFFTGGQSGAVQKTMNDNIEKMENIIAHDVSNLIGAGLLLVFAVGAAVFHQCTACFDDCCRIVARVYHSVFGFRREAWAEDLDGSQPFFHRTGRGFSE